MGWGGGGGSQGIGTQPAHAVFHPGQLKNRSFWNLFFWYCDHLKWPSKVCKACFRPYLSRFSPYLGIRSRGGGGSSQGIGAQPAYAVFHPGQLKNRSFWNLFLWYGDHLKWTSKVCFRPYLRRFSPYLGIRSGWGVGGGGSQGIGTQPAHAVFHPGQLKNRSFWNLFFWYCDHLKWPSKVCKACFRPYLSRFSPYLGIRSRGGGGGLPRDRYTTCLCSFSPWAAQNSKFLKLVFLILWSPKMTIQGM